ncbi:hypothetical protein PLESTM_000518700 [Pleodorina starrii]|nr:hypothetical protein PLESTM_000518700 [Pleodorina starrii]
MGYFRLFNNWWSNFYAQYGRRPTKMDIETWRAENPTWRPELTLDEIVQHSKGRRDPEKNRQYFVEYRRKLKVSGPARTRGGAGGRAAAKRLGNDEPWQATTSDEDQQQQEDDTDDDTDEEVAQTASLRLRRQQQHMFPRAKPQGQVRGLTPRLMAACSLEEK